MRFRRRPRIQWVEDYIYRHLRHGPLHWTLIDPDRQTPRQAAAIAKAAADAGSHLILVGGSTSDATKLVDKTCKAVKRASGLPVVLFPGGATQVSAHADAILWMSLLNSKDPRFLVGEQVAGALAVDRMGLEPIPMGYLVIKPGGTVGKVGKAQLIDPTDHDSAIRYALAAQYFGMRFIYLEAGSGAATPVAPSLIRAVKTAVNIPIIVGGGIRSVDAAHDAIEAGADVIVTGTLVEGALDVRKTLGGLLFDLSEQLKREVRRRLDLGDDYAGEGGRFKKRPARGGGSGPPEPAADGIDFIR